MSTPLPAARPSAFTTKGPPAVRMKSTAVSISVKTPYGAVGIPCRRMKSLANAFDHSNSAAARLGPNTGMPRAPSRSASPSASGASGPTTTRPMSCASAQSAIASTSVIGISTVCAIVAIPGFPGAAQIRLTDGDRASAHTSACSLAPDPTTSTEYGTVRTDWVVIRQPCPVSPRPVRRDRPPGHL